ncbi:22290_t:CDS:2 [Rhizophagus irregularis]|nr:22290_t:CDS:2 [Rhizophagus irregularis]
MNATNFNNEKFEYMEDVSWVMSVASSAQSPQTKNYLAKKSGGYKNSPNPPFIPLALSVQQFLENPTRFDAKVSDDNMFQKSTS